MSDKVSESRIRIPLWRVLQDSSFLKYEVERMAREFGYHQMTERAVSYSQAVVELEIRITQGWTES